MRRRPAVLIAAGFGVFVFLGLSLLLARGLTGSSAERGQGARSAGGAGARRRGAVLAKLPACRAEPACAQVTARARGGAASGPGEVQILNYQPSARLSLTRRTGTGRVAWRAGRGCRSCSACACAARAR